MTNAALRTLDAAGQVLAFALSAFAVYAAGFGVFNTIYVDGAAVALGAAYGFVQLAKNSLERGPELRRDLAWTHRLPGGRLAPL